MKSSDLISFSLCQQLTVFFKFQNIGKGSCALVLPVSMNHELAKRPHNWRILLLIVEKELGIRISFGITKKSLLFIGKNIL